MNGNVSATGLVTGAGYQIGSNLFAFGSYANWNAFLGFGGTTATTGTWNTAIGVWALANDTTGSSNTVTGSGALTQNTTGGYNTATGVGALGNNTTGTFNAASGYQALYYIQTGNNNTALGYMAGPDQNSTNLTNSTAIGANAVVSESNALVLGCTAGLNSCPAAVNVGIGTATPAYTLDVQGSGRFTQPIVFAPSQTFPGTGTITGVTAGTDLTGGGASGNVTLNVDTTKVVTGVTAGTDLTGGGTGGALTLNLDTTKVPQLAANNTFAGRQTINNNVAVTATGNTLSASGGSTGLYGSGATYGVYGGSGSSGSGVYGTTSDTTGNYAGVYGANYSSGANAVGVYGNSEYGYGVNGSSYYGIGVLANAGTNIAVFAENDSAVTYTLFAHNYSASGYPFVANNVSGAGCNIDPSGNINCTGSKNAVVPIDGGQRKVALSAIESPKNWFEDFGSARLSNGSAVVAIEPEYGQTVNTELEYHVFLTPKGDCQGLYVTNETPGSFEVRELGNGTSNVRFDYRIVALRRNFENIRMADHTNDPDPMKMMQERGSGKPFRFGTSKMKLPERPAAPTLRPPAHTGKPEANK